MPLFAVFTEQNPVGISADEFRQRLPEGFAHHLDLVSRGVIKHSWIIPGRSGGLNVYDVRSHEELTDALHGNPLSSHLSFQVFPLSDPGTFDVEEFATRDQQTDEEPEARAEAQAVQQTQEPVEVGSGNQAVAS